MADNKLTVGEIVFDARIDDVEAKKDLEKMLKTLREMRDTLASTGQKGTEDWKRTLDYIAQVGEKLRVVTDEYKKQQLAVQESKKIKEEEFNLINKKSQKEAVALQEEISGKKKVSQLISEIVEKTAQAGASSSSSEAEANRQLRINRITELRKQLLYDNANTIERMQHNRQVLNSRLQKSNVLDANHKNILQQINDIENKIHAAKAKTQITAKEAYKIADRRRRLDQQKVNHEKSIARQQALRLQREKKITQENTKQVVATQSIGQQLKGAFSQAFSIQKIANRLAFVMTAFLSYAVFNGIQRGLKSIVETTIEWEAELSKIFGLLRVSDSMVRESLTNNVKNLMSQYGQGLKDSTRAVYDILSARFSPDEVGIISEASAKLAIGEFVDIAKSVDVVTTTLNAFNMTASESERVINGLASLVTDGKTRLEELQPVIGKLYSIAGELNFTFEETNAALSVLTQKGIKTNVAITALRQLMFKLQSPTEKNTKLMKEFGIEIDNETIKEKGLAGVLEQLTGAHKQLLIDITGTRRGAVALLPLLGDMTSYYSALEAQTNGAGEAQRKYNERADDAQVSLAKMRQSFKLLGVEIGGSVNPYLNEFYRLITEINSRMLDINGNKIDGKFSKISKAIGGIAVALGVGGATWGILRTLFGTKAAGAVLANIAKSYSQIVGSISKLAKFTLSKGAITASMTVTPTDFMEDPSVARYLEQKEQEDNASRARSTRDELTRLRVIAAQRGITIEQLKEEIALESRNATTQEYLKELYGDSYTSKWEIIQLAKDELSLAESIYKEEKERYNLQVQINGETSEGIRARVSEIDVLIESQKAYNETQTDKERINEGETKLLKLQAEQVKLLNTANKKDLDLSKAKYNAGEINSAQLLIAYKTYLGTLKEGTLEWYRAEDALNSFKSSLVDLEVGASFEQMADLRAYIYGAIANGEADISGDLMNVFNNSKMTNEQLMELLTLLNELIDLNDEEASAGGGKFSVLGALGIKEYQGEADMIADIESQLAGTLNNVWDGFLNAQLNRIETWKQAELDALDDRYDAYEDNALSTAMTEEHKNNQLSALNKKKAEEQKEIEKEAADRLADQKKRNAIYQATIDYARGLISIYAAYTGDGTYGISASTMAALLTGIYATNIALISATEYKASGGKIDGHPGGPRGTDTVPAWLTPGEVVIQESASRGNEGPLLSANRELAKGKSFTQFATEYLAGKVSSFSRIAMPSQYYQVGGRVAGASSSGVNVDMSAFVSVAREQIDSLEKQNKLLSALYKTSKKNEKNTDRLRKKTNRY